MSLPDLAALEALDNKTLTKLRDRLASIGLVGAKIEPILRTAGGVHPLLRRPLLRHHLRKVKEPYAYAARALMFSDPVSRAELGEALGDWTSAVVDFGLVGEGEGGMVSPLCMTMINDRYVLTDDLSQGGAAVMGLGPMTTPLCAASLPRKKIGRALDLGCGAGTIALVLAKMADKVFATDINPRALALTKLNARLNSIFNVETREGSLFEPVGDERFDVISSQPPFIPQTEEGKTGDFMQGGLRGDELARQLFAKLGRHLTAKGRGFFAIEWGHGPDIEAPMDRVRSSLGDASADVLLFQSSPISADTHAAEYAAALHPQLGSAFEAEAIRRREHCARMGIDVMVPTLCVVRRVDGRPARMDVLPTGAGFSPNAKRIDKLLAARDVASALDSLLKAKLRMVDGVLLREEQNGPGISVESTMSAIMPPKAMTEPVRLTPTLLRLTTCIHEAASVKAGIEAYAERFQSEEGPRELIPQIAHVLLAGLMEVAD